MKSPQPRLRIAIGQISQESNAFVATQTAIDLFENSYLYQDQELFTLANSNTEISGMLGCLRAADAEIIPMIATRSVSGGPLSDACYIELKHRLLERLRKAGPLDGLLLSLHGAMLSVTEDDPEGDLLCEIRGIVGDHVPVVATLDLHAHVTQRMMRYANALVAYAHYPHDDTVATGERGAQLLLKALRGQANLVMAMAKVPMLASGCNGQTFGDAPMSQLSRRARELEQRDGVLSISCIQVHPNLDQPDLGCGAIVVTDGDLALAVETAEMLAREFWDRRWEFIPEMFTVSEAVTAGRATEGPVVIVDAADCAGGGAAGDSVAVLRELIEFGMNEPTYLMVVDPQAAALCAHAGTNQTVELNLGYGIDPTWGRPINVVGRVETLSDGHFQYRGGPFGGTWASMGPSAVLQVGTISILITSQPTYDWLDEQYRSVGLDPGIAKFICAKNPMNYRFAYKDIAARAFVVDTPGPTPPNIRRLPYRNLHGSVFPFEDSPVPPNMATLTGSYRHLEP